MAFMRSVIIFIVVALSSLQAGNNVVLNSYFVKIPPAHQIGEDVFSRHYGFETPPNWQQTMSAQLAHLLFGVSFEELVLKRDKIMENCLKHYYDPKAPKINVIPHITHRVWITDNNNPHEVPLDKLNIYVKSLRSFVVNPNWKHYFWCLDPSKIPQTIKFLKNTGLNIEIKTISEIFPRMRARHLFEALYKDRRYTQASDIVRMNILFQMGGVYSDMGILLKGDITPIIDRFEQGWWLTWFGCLDVTMIAAAPGNRFINKFLDTIHQLHALPPEIKALTPDPLTQRIWTASEHINAVIDSMSTPSDKIFLFQDGPFIERYNFDSWFDKGKFGNIAISESKLDYFSVKSDS